MPIPGHNSLFMQLMARQWAEHNQQRENEQRMGQLLLQDQQRKHEEQKVLALGEQARADKLAAEQWRQQMGEREAGLAGQRLSQQAGQFEESMGLRRSEAQLGAKQFMENLRLRERELETYKRPMAQARMRTAARGGTSTLTREQREADRTFKALKAQLDTVRMALTNIRRQRRPDRAAEAGASAELMKYQTLMDAFIKRNPRYAEMWREAVEAEPPPTTGAGPREAAPPEESDEEFFYGG